MSFLPSAQGFLKFVVGASASSLLLACGALYIGQTYIIYPSYVPSGSRENVPTPADYEIPYEDVHLTASDGTKVLAYLMKQRKTLVGSNAQEAGPHRADNVEALTDDEYAAKRPTVLFFHANAGNVGHRLPFGRIFYRNIRCNVLMLSYRGYGKSEGSPSEKGIQLDSQAALDHILAHPILGSTKLIYYGQSLGGAVAIDLAGRNPSHLHALILENTFTSIREMAEKVMPKLVPFLFLCTEHWRSLLAMARIPEKVKILMLSGMQDELVPPEHMKQLWDKATESTSEGRVWVEFEDGTHNDTCVQPGYWAAVRNFICSFDGYDDGGNAEKTSDGPLTTFSNRL